MSRGGIIAQEAFARLCARGQSEHKKLAVLAGEIAEAAVRRADVHRHDP